MKLNISNFFKGTSMNIENKNLIEETKSLLLPEFLYDLNNFENSENIATENITINNLIEDENITTDNITENSLQNNEVKIDSSMFQILELVGKGKFL